MRAQTRAALAAGLSHPLSKVHHSIAIGTFMQNETDLRPAGTTDEGGRGGRSVGCSVGSIERERELREGDSSYARRPRALGELVRDGFIVSLAHSWLAKTQEQPRQPYN